MKSLLYVTVFSVSLMVLTSCATSQPKATKNLKQAAVETLDSTLQKVFAKHELMGMSVVLIAKNQMAWRGYYGKADLARDIPITEHTMYRVASISKSITTTALLQLWEDGKVNLDRDVSQYLGWKLRNPLYPDNMITLRQLLSHQSSINDGKLYSKFASDMIEKKLNIKALFQPDGTYFSDDMFIDHEPGSYFSYANCTWGIIASVIEAVSGQRFDAYCSQHILQPMGLKATFNTNAINDIDSLAVLYRYNDEVWQPQTDNHQGQILKSRSFDGYKVGQNGLLFGPQGSLRSSAIDLAKFSLMLINDGNYNGSQILKAQTVQTMLQSHWVYNGTNGDTWENLYLSYGFGTHQTLKSEQGNFVFPDRDMVGHPGVAYGLLSDMYFDKKSKSGIVFITNGSKRKFQQGESTFYYQVEEDVFKAVYPYLNTLER